MVWFYGGGFLAASSADYDGSPIVAHSVSRGTPIIYVSFNYRIGPFGVCSFIGNIDVMLKLYSFLKESKR
jgi:carboxylesterase type B